MKVASSVVTASQSNKERTLTSTSSRSALGYEGASGSDEASDAESAHSKGSNEAITLGSDSQATTLPDGPTHHASSNEDQRSESTPAPRYKTLHRLMVTLTDGA